MSDQPRKISSFHLTRLVHEGDKSEIYEARYQQPGGGIESAAVKLLKPAMAYIGDELRGFLRELGWARDLRNPIAPRVLEAGEQGGSYFLAMEFVEGWTLGELMRSLAVLQIPLPSQVALTIVHQIAQGVHQMHEFAEGGELLGVVHLGIQPENIMLRALGGAMLIDFGVTTAETSGEVVELDERIDAYQAPERLRMLPVDRRADIYSLGRVLEDLAQSMSPVELGADLPALIARACHLHVEERFSTMEELAEAIELVARNRGFEVSRTACQNFTAEVFGRSEASRPAQAASPPVAPLVMESAGLETAFAPPEEEHAARVAKEKFHMQATTLGEVPRPEAGAEVEGLATVMGGPDVMVTERGGPEGLATVMGGPDVMATERGGPEGLATVMGGPDVMVTERGGPEGLATVTGGPDVAATERGGPNPGTSGAGALFGNEELTEQSVAPSAPRDTGKGKGKGKRFVDEHQAVTVMGAPQMLADMANSEETTAVVPESARAALGFPEELIPTRSYEETSEEEDSEEKTSVGAAPDSEGT